MSKNTTVIAVSVLGTALAAVVAAVAVTLRRARTVHPPVAPAVPRIEDLR